MPTVALKPGSPRYKYLNLFKIRQPLPAFVSITHRVTGALLFVMLWFFLWLLQRSLHDFASFNALKSFVGQWPVKLVLLGFLWAYLHHVFAGIRHLFIDLDIGLDLPDARRSSVLVFVAGAVCTLIVGVLVW